VSLDRFIAGWMHPDYPPRQVSEQDLAAVEMRFGFEFPPDYRDAVPRFGLVAPTIALLDAIVDRQLDMVALSELLDPAEMIASTEGWREMGLPADLVAFASDGCGNLFCFRTDGDGTIFYFDHDFGTVRPAAPSFAGWIDDYCALLPSEER
jgi:hypothetical protein